MLVLSRKSNEKIQIGDNISITILQTKGNRVRIGIEAPPETRVLRGELFAAEMLHSSDEAVSHNIKKSVLMSSDSNREPQADSTQIDDLYPFKENEGPKSSDSSADPEGLSFVPLRDNALKNLAKKHAKRNLNQNSGTSNRLIQILEESRQQDILPLDNRF